MKVERGNMFYYKIDFCFIDEFVDREKADDKLYWYLSVLYKNGNALSDYKVIAKEKGYEVYIGLFDRYPIKEESYRNKYINEYEEKIKEYFVVSYDCLGELDGYGELCDCEKPSSYLMYTTQFDEEMLVLCGDCGGIVPLYKLPYLEPYEEEHLALLGWQDGYHAMDKMWLYAGTEGLERSALYQLHNPKSPLSTWGRALCKELEEKTGVPTYYYLFSSTKKYRKCPSCGNPWKEEADGVCDFFCDECRLAADK